MGRSARTSGRDAPRRPGPGEHAGSRHDKPVTTRPAAGGRTRPLAVRRAYVRSASQPNAPAQYFRPGGGEQFCLDASAY